MNPLIEAKSDFNRRIDAEGWWRGDEVTSGVCPVVTIMDLTREDCDEVLQAIHAASSQLFPERITLPPSAGSSTAQVNDHPDTTRADLDAVFDKAAELWKENHQS